MPAKTHGEKIDELFLLTTVLDQSVGNLGESVKKLELEVSGLKERAHALETRIAILETHVQNLQEEKKEWARRPWLIVGPILGAIAGSVVTYFLKR